MSWVIIALISVVSLSGAAIYQKIAMRDERSDPVVSSIVFQYVLTIITLIYALIVGFKLPPMELFFPYFFISAIVYAYGTLFFFKAIKLIEASENAILSSFGVFATIGSSYIFLGERLNGKQFIGLGLILVSVIAVNLKKNKFKFNLGALYSLAGATLYGLALTNDTYIVRSFDAVSYVPIMSFMPGVVLSIMFLGSFKKITKDLRKSINKDLMIFCVLYGIQAVTFYLALTGGATASQLGSFVKIQVVLNVILATIFLKERDNLPLKFVAGVLTVVGGYLVT